MASKKRKTSVKTRIRYVTKGVKRRVSKARGFLAGGFMGKGFIMGAGGLFAAKKLIPTLGGDYAPAVQKMAVGVLLKQNDMSSVAGKEAAATLIDNFLSGRGVGTIGFNVGGGTAAAEQTGGNYL